MVPLSVLSLNLEDEVLTHQVGWYHSVPWVHPPAFLRCHSSQPPVIARLSINRVSALYLSLPSCPKAGMTHWLRLLGSPPRGEEEVVPILTGRCSLYRLLLSAVWVLRWPMNWWSRTDYSTCRHDQTAATTDERDQTAFPRYSADRPNVVHWFVVHLFYDICTLVVWVVI